MSEDSFTKRNTLAHSIANLETDELETYKDSTNTDIIQSDSEDFEKVLKLVGSNGKYQKYLLYFFLAPFIFIEPMSINANVFMLSEPQHLCRIPAEDKYSPHELNKQRTLWLPRDVGKNGVEPFIQCYMYASPENHSRIPCQFGYDYDHADYSNTITSEFNWICNEAWYVPTTFAIIPVGGIFGSIGFGLAGDKFGRKKCFFLSCLILFVFLLVRLLLVHVPLLYIAATFIWGSTYPIIQIQLYTLTLESTEKGGITWMYTLTWIAWILGACVLPLFAWWSRSWLLLGLIVAIPILPFFFFYPLILESPRWLLSQNKISKAEAVLTKIAKINGTSNNFQSADLRKMLSAISAKQIGKKKRSVNIFSLFSTWTLARNTLLLTVTTSVTLLNIYFLSMEATSVPGNQFINYCFIALADFPAIFVSGYITNKAGRRWTATLAFIGMLLAYSSAIAATSIQCLTGILVPSLVVCNFFGTIANFVEHLQTAEIFPTELRSTGAGFCNTIGLIVSAAAPWIIYVGKTYKPFPYILFAGLSFMGFLSASLLPETINQSLPETIEDATLLGTNATFWSYLPTDYKAKPVEAT